MDFGSAGGVSTLQSGLPSSTIFGVLPNNFANSADEKALQQHHQQRQLSEQQQNQQAQFFLQQQLKLKAQNTSANGSQPAFVTPSALTSAPEAPPSIISDSSTQSSRGWQDSPASNSLSSPTSSIISPHPSSVSPPVDPLILSPEQETKPQPAETTELPKRRRGRPRLSETNARATRAAPSTATAASSTGTKVQQRKAAAARRASTASVSGADEFRGENGSDDKKNRIRARNREAAYKCRQKKQKGIEELQSQEAVAENINRSLTAEAAMLRGEILMLKNMVLQHGGCGCSYIEEYISGAAQNLVHSSMAAAAAAPPAGPGGRPDMVTHPGVDGAEGEGFVDWKMFDMDRRSEMRPLDSESGFSGLDDVSVSHSARAQSQGAMMA
ncbi:transcription factor atf21 [Colletotrichum truncatum]|uniref:Transcription factor atf21 n=1 Tax=Colletotrichum truncatum TaxID=5467 RepID=A0ACC3YRU8_COLTU|nr:transcription factor atf21 [Colletotrichum truncatum]KAF6799307.1 transcription factor atf21 [Colletotrichum truncatum]